MREGRCMSLIERLKLGSELKSTLAIGKFLSKPGNIPRLAQVRVCQTDLSGKSSSAAASYILSLPPVLQTAVKADSLPQLDSHDAVTLLVQQSEARRRQAFVDSVIPPPPAKSPIECRLYDEVFAHVVVGRRIHWWC